MRLCSYRIEYYITADIEKVSVLLNENSFKPPLKEMTNPAVPLIKCLGIHAIEPPHSLRQVSIRCFNDQVIVVVHQAIGIANPMETLRDLSKRL
jgi:hypothetical protein